jgi:hypothetical protein
LRLEILSDLTAVEVFIIKERLETGRGYQAIANSISCGDGFCRQTVFNFLESFRSTIEQQGVVLPEVKSTLVDTLDEVGVRIVRTLGERPADDSQYHSLAVELGISSEECRGIHDAYRLSRLESDYSRLVFKNDIKVQLTNREKQVIELREPDCEMPASYDEISKRVGMPSSLCEAIYHWYERLSDEELEREGYTLTV